MTNGNRALFVPRPFISASLHVPGLIAGSRCNIISLPPTIVFRLLPRTHRDAFFEQIISLDVFAKRKLDKSRTEQLCPPFLLLFLFSLPLKRLAERSKFQRRQNWKAERCQRDSGGRSSEISRDLLIQRILVEESNIYAYRRDIFRPLCLLRARLLRNVVARRRPFGIRKIA